MRARLTSLLLATAWVAGVGCASKPAEEPSAAAADHACATSFAAPQANDHDTDIDSILTQPTSDPRLAQINRRMYLSLRTLDAELRREERLAACQLHPLDSATLRAQANNQPGAGGGAAVGGTGYPTENGAMGSSAIAAGLPVTSSTTGASGAAVPASGSTAATPAKSISIRKASLSANGGGGNGATAPKITPGNDNDVVLRRLRKAAEQETNPALRAKLWKEYTDYRQGTSAK